MNENNQLQKQDSEIISSLVLNGDVSKMSPAQRVTYYKSFCESLGLNPLTQPFQILRLNGKEKLYATKDATEQLRKLHGVSIHKLEKSIESGLCIFTAYAKDKEGKEDASSGAVNIEGLKGENLANAIMKAETKAKRRVTLSICGLGILDESEIESIPNAVVVEPKPEVVEAEDAGIYALHKQYMTLWSEYESLMGYGAAERLHPDSWKEEHRKSVKAYQGAIKSISEKIESQKVTN